MNKNELLKLDEAVKITKTDLFIIYPDRIIGTDSTLVIITELNYISSVDKPYEFTRQVWDTFIKAVKAESQDRGEYLPWFSKFCTKRISVSPIDVQYRRMCTMYMEDCGTCSKTISDFQNTEWFKEYNSLRAADGAKLFKIDRQHMFYLATGIIPVNKGEKVDLNFVDFYKKDENGNNIFMCFCVHFYIHKKKGYELHRAIAFRPLV